MSSLSTNDPKNAPEKKELIDKPLDGVDILKLRRNVVNQGVDQLISAGKVLGVVEELIAPNQPVIHNVIEFPTATAIQADPVQKSPQELQILAQINALHEEAA